jgi:hypothetical protein
VLFLSAANHNTAADEKGIFVVHLIVGDVQADQLLGPECSKYLSRNLVDKVVSYVIGLSE